MADSHHIPRAHLIGLAALALGSALVADYLWFRLSMMPPKTVPLDAGHLMDEISNIASARWYVKGGS